MLAYWSQVGLRGEEQMDKMLLKFPSDYSDRKGMNGHLQFILLHHHKKKRGGKKYKIQTSHLGGKRMGWREQGTEES